MESKNTSFFSFQPVSTDEVKDKIDLLMALNV